MALFRKKKWEDMPSSGDLAELVMCEREFVLKRNTGSVTVDPAMRARSEEGEREHLVAQRNMESFHNAEADSRCFVASAVYGAESAQTEELREFRDDVLVKTAAGRALVSGYYRVSPPIAKFLADSPKAAAPVRRVLDAVRSAVRP